MYYIVSSNNGVKHLSIVQSLEDVCQCQSWKYTTVINIRLDSIGGTWFLLLRRSPVILEGLLLEVSLYFHYTSIVLHLVRNLTVKT